MALIPCTECGGTVSTKASACPHCGCLIAVQSANEAVVPASCHVSMESKHNTVSDIGGDHASDGQLPQKSSWLTQAISILVILLALIGIDKAFPDAHILDSVRLPGMKSSFGEQNRQFQENRIRALGEINSGWYWDVQFGMFNDDVFLVIPEVLSEGQSGLQLHNVSLDLNLMVNGKPKSLKLAAEKVDAGTTVTWSNVVSMAKNSFQREASTASLTADELDGVNLPKGPGKALSRFRFTPQLLPQLKN